MDLSSLRSYYLQTSYHYGMLIVCLELGTLYKMYHLVLTTLAHLCDVATVIILCIRKLRHKKIK